MFDHASSDGVNAKIFSFATLLSSIHIFNIGNLIDEKDLQYLDFIIGYGQLLKSPENSADKPLDHLVFLMRDWEHSRQYQYGFEGGSKYLEEKVLAITDYQLAGMRKMRENLKTTFSKIECFLMPHPGKNIVKSEFDGSWSKLDEDFVEQLKVLIPELLSPKNLVAKKQNGRDMAVADYFETLKIFVKVFSSKDLPEPLSALDSVVALHLKPLVDKCLESYNTQVSQIIPTIDTISEFKLAHIKTKEAILQTYENEAKLGNANHKKTYRELLLQGIDKMHEQLSLNADILIQKKTVEKEKEAEVRKRLEENENHQNEIKRINEARAREIEELSKRIKRKKRGFLGDSKIIFIG